MALLLKKLYQGVHLIDEVADKRVDNYFLLKNPFGLFSIALVYLYFCLNLGPKCMKNRPAFNLKLPIIIFNFFQVVVNAYLFYEGLICFLNINFYCAPIVYTKDPTALRILNGCYIFFLVKQVDLIDTVFFILRKKHTQVSFLHVYHHFIMSIGSWTGVKFWAGGASIAIVMVNSLVHTVMYIYYLLTSYDPKYKTSVWWKKHITQLQLGQFLFFIIYFGRFFFMSNCGYPKVVSFLFVPQNVFMFVLFSDFYYKAYVKRKV